MRLDTNMRASLAAACGLAIISTGLTYLLLKFFFTLLHVPAGGAFLVLICMLMGVFCAVLFFRNIREAIAEYGVPGMLPGRDIFDSTLQISLSLQSSNTLSGGAEQFAAHVPSRKFADFFGKKHGNSVTFRTSDSKCLTISYPASGDETLLVKLQTNGQTVCNLEITPGTVGEYTTLERGNSRCDYSMTFVGCDGDTVAGWLMFFGETKMMRTIFLNSSAP